jgi:UDP-N-acetylglucosamine transferase subunit ALG13
LIEALDRIAGAHQLSIFAQTADPNAHLEHIDHAPYVTPLEYRRFTNRARVLVGHAGIGTVVTAKELRKPLIIFPRHAALGEHRNDHQLATAKTLQASSGIYVAHDPSELAQLLQAQDLVAASMEETPERQALICRISNYLEELKASRTPPEKASDMASR